MTAEHGPQMAGRVREPEADEDIDHARQQHERRADCGEQHDGRELPHPALLQPDRTREHIGAMMDAGGGNRHQRHAATDAKQRQGGKVECERDRERVTLHAAQHGVATDAARDRAGRHRRHDLDLPAVPALQQVRPGERLGFRNRPSRRLGQSRHQTGLAELDLAIMPNP